MKNKLFLVLTVLATLGIYQALAETKVNPGRAVTVTTTETVVEKKAPIKVQPKPRPVISTLAVPEELIQNLSEILPGLLIEARQELAEHDNLNAAQKFMAAAALVKIETLRASAEMGPKLKNAAVELERLARLVARNESTDFTNLNQMLGSLELNLARHYDDKAKKFMTAKNAVKAGKELSAAIDHFLNGMMWLGKNLTDSEQQAIRHSADLSASLVRDKFFAADIPDQDNQNMSASSDIIRRYFQSEATAGIMSDMEE